MSLLLLPVVMFVVCAAVLLFVVFAIRGKLQGGAPLAADEFTAAQHHVETQSHIQRHHDAHQIAMQAHENAVHAAHDSASSVSPPDISSPCPTPPGCPPATNPSDCGCN